MKLFFFVWRRLRNLKNSNRNRLISEMRSIDISCTGPPRLGQRQRINLPNTPHSSGFLDPKSIGGDSSKRRKINNHTDRRLSGVDTKGCSDRLFNTSCSLVEAKKFILQSCRHCDTVSASQCSVESLLQSIPRCLISDFPKPPSTTNPSSSGDSPPFLPSKPTPALDLPSIVSPALFRTQSGAVRSLYSYPDTTVLDPSPGNGPVWGRNGVSCRPGQNGPELFFKLAVCTGSTASRVWCDEDSYSVNLFRSLLTGTDNSSSSSSSRYRSAKNICLARQYVPCHKHRTGEIIMRYANVSVVDMCGDLDPRSLNGPDFIRNHAGGKQMRKGSSEDANSSQGVTDGQTDINTQGMQAALIIVPSVGWTDSTGVLSTALCALSDAMLFHAHCGDT
jgi:hypothetical protein